MNDLDKFSKEAFEIIKKSNSILLHCHPHADPDSVASVLAMRMYLNQIKKKCTVIQGDTEIPKDFSFFPGFDQIIPKSFDEIKLENFDLFIILDSGGKTLISQKKEVTFPKSLKTILIDHHASKNDIEANLRFVDSEYVSTTEILFDLFKSWKAEIDSEMALCLYIGIYTDSRGFRVKPWNFETFGRVSEIAKINPLCYEGIFKLENSLTPEKIAYRAEALSNVTPYFHNSVAISTVDYSFLNEKKISESDQSSEKTGIANAIKSVVGWEIAVLITELRKGHCSISFRGRSKYDLAKIAVSLGGGGHSEAAAAKLDGDVESVKNEVIKAIKINYPELGNP